MVTFFAPPHWLFLTVDPSEEQALRCLQVEPSSMPYWNSRVQENSGEMSMVSTEKEPTSSDDDDDPELDPEPKPELPELPELLELLELLEPQPKEGDEETSWPQEPEITFWVRGAKRLPGVRLAKPVPHENPPQDKPPYELKDPSSRSPQLKPDDCCELHSLLVLPGLLKLEASFQFFEPTC